MSLTAPIAKDNFAFANGDLFAEASGGNRHRRATAAELKTHFKSGNDKDHPAHWFEAQCLHYGLPPSKTKAVARMRLYDAVKGGSLSVPASVQKLETELKKEWTKKDREAKKALKGSTTVAKTATTTTKAAGTKRKAENVDLTVDVGGIQVKLSTNNGARETAAKKAKTTTAAMTAKSSTPKAKASATSASKATKATPAPKVKAVKPEKEKPASKPSASAKSSPAKQTAHRRGTQTLRGGISQGPGRKSAAASSSSPEKPARTKQTARRSGSFVARGRIPTGGMCYEESPPPYSEYADDDYDDYEEDAPLAPLGLLNGRYEIKSTEVSEQWTHYGQDFGLILTLAGSSMWGSFDLGVIEGVLFIERRPYQSSHEPIHFKWRGREDQGPMLYGNHNSGWIKFLGDGRVEGEFDYQCIDFRGKRAPGQGTKSEIDARILENEWDGYNEREYEAENQARWN
ncbi:uncharacterized protein BCR38DRAFT_451525 [Pseudomassariella vexata]|uniref:Uncharacterized protein n=1 Tax=Pseudomassariella vexata TaxID=1141098 RepID=A0A1Y2DA99_9PEZI|nr:uncharacterized protein BCR38DRAFT_451525 [Pseudomassariella vexata]ORY56127.1 hypothetical protein BCR38DRAFT_451525 [Pseudomassariella vexata]